jgi:hypothetical protein
LPLLNGSKKEVLKGIRRSGRGRGPGEVCCGSNFREVRRLKLGGGNKSNDEREESGDFIHRYHCHIARGGVGMSGQIVASNTGVYLRRIVEGPIVVGNRDDGEEKDCKDREGYNLRAHACGCGTVVPEPEGNASQRNEQPNEIKSQFHELGTSIYQAKKSGESAASCSSCAIDR